MNRCSQSWFLQSFSGVTCLLLLALQLHGCGSDSATVAAPPSNTVVVETTLGKIQTTPEAGASLLAFKGIPYAKPPIGELRFAAPEALTEYDPVTLVADHFASACPQAESLIEAASVNEDCLYLNVYTPDVAGRYPVMVWLHGGAFVAGSGGEAYQPERLVAQGVIVVTINYRLGALGFLTHSAVGSGNWGLLDQQLALRWVRDNIAEFGGDASNVTLFGESAGGHSVMSQLASPTAKGLFDKAIVQSGAYFAEQWNAASSTVIGSLIAAELGCTSPGEETACLRAATVENILAAQKKVLGQTTGGIYMPAIDGTLLPDSFAARIAAGNFNWVPVLVGGNANEGRYFTALSEAATYLAALDSGAGQATAIAEAPLSDDTKYLEAVSNLLAVHPELDAPTIANDYLNRQDSSDIHRYSLAISALQTDGQFACSTLDLTAKLAQYVATYSYRFSDQNAPSLIASSHLPISGFAMGAAHAFDVQYVLDSEAAMRERGGGNEQIALSNAMLSYWAQFAKTADPNSTATPLSWDRFDARASDPFILELNTPAISASSASQFQERHSCTYWETPPLK